jgi:hypothetical protein
MMRHCLSSWYPSCFKPTIALIGITRTVASSVGRPMLCRNSRLWRMLAITVADITRVIPNGPFDSDDAQSLIEAVVKGVGITPSCASRSRTSLPPDD